MVRLLLTRATKNSNESNQQSHSRKEGNSPFPLPCISQPSPLDKRTQNIPCTTLLHTLVFLNPCRHIPRPTQNRQPCTKRSQSQHLVISEHCHIDLFPPRHGIVVKKIVCLLIRRSWYWLDEEAGKAFLQSTSYIICYIIFFSL